jgi:hypothetical protein
MAELTAVQEYDAILACLQQYVEGGRAGKSEVMKPAFHELATIAGYLGEELIAAPIAGLFDWVDNNPPAEGLQLRVGSVDVQGSIASVRLEMDNWGGHRFTDMMTLLKTDGEWKVMSKVFYLHG